MPNVAEQAVLEGLGVRLIVAEEEPHWNQEITRRHYLKNARLVGEQLRYVAEYQGQWLALLGWSAATFHVKGRDAWLGWTAEQRRTRRPFLAQNSRFLVLTDRHQLPNLARRALALCCQRRDDAGRHGRLCAQRPGFLRASQPTQTTLRAPGSMGWNRKKTRFPPPAACGRARIWRANSSVWTPSTPSTKPPPGLSWAAAPIISSPSRPIRTACGPPRKPSGRVLFFPQDPERRKQRTAKTDEINRRRHEIREWVTRPIEPAEPGLLGAAQVARLDRHRTEQADQSDTPLWLTTSRPIQTLPPLAFNQARRQEWGIDNGLHYVWDLSGDEDKRLRARNLNSLCVLTPVNRVRVAVGKKTKAKRPSYYAWRQDQKARPAALLRILCASP